MMRAAVVIVAIAAGFAARGAQSPAESQPTTAAAANAHAIEFHNARRLDEASRDYARVLSLDPPRAPVANELAIVRRFTPRLYTTAAEFFPLRDFAAVLHPTDRLIAYHMFWEDDIDFPEDNDPCDHELVWVRFSPDGSSLERLWTYFHGRILTAGEAALRDAREHAMRPRVNVQWGKHGSLPDGWEGLPIVADDRDIERKYLTAGTPITLADYNRATWQKLRSEGRRLKEHPLARRLKWPDTFDGDWNQFSAFNRAVDPLPILDRERMVMVSRWNNAVIDQHFLAYNFRAKTEWPPETASPARAADSASAAIVRANAGGRAGNAPTDTNGRNPAQGATATARCTTSDTCSS